VLQIFFAIVTAAAFVGVATLVVRRFVMGTQWFLSDMYFVIVLSAAPLALILRDVQPSLLGLREAELLMLLCTVVELPVLIGAWWGLNCAQRMDEQRALRRYALIFACVLSAAGALGLIYSFFATVVIFVQSGTRATPASEIMLKVGGSWVAAIVLVIPGYLVEGKCRVIEGARRRKGVEERKSG